MDDLHLRTRTPCSASICLVICSYLICIGVGADLDCLDFVSDFGCEIERGTITFDAGGLRLRDLRDGFGMRRSQSVSAFMVD